MTKQYTKKKKADLFFLVVSILGTLLSTFTLRTALLQEDNFRIFTSIIWVVLFAITVIRNSGILKRKENSQ